MKNVDMPLLKQVASNLMFDMKENEYFTLLEEFDIIIRHGTNLSNSGS